MARIRSDFPRTPRVVDHVFIPLADGIRLAARIWLPEDAEADPVPAVLEYLPYRFVDGTASGDHQQMTYFAGCGYAGVRVDMRGNGSSDGVMLDEYTVQEQLDALEVIAWLAEQPWCTGAVGMIGGSWGGFNGLQVAARRPPALKTVISFFASDDRYGDDVHYRGGLHVPMDMLQWACSMMALNAKPPDPKWVGDDWRERWRARLEGTPPFIEPWLSHQRYDDYWKQGSVKEDYSAIECPIYAIGGWTDGYTDAPLRLLQHLDVPRRALIGPWGHVDPTDGTPGPSAGTLDECVRWFDRWLKGIENGIDEEPALIAYMQESVVPRALIDERPGRWVAEEEWPSARIRPLTLHLAETGLGPERGPDFTRQVGTVLTCGMLSGAWCADGKSADLALDQRPEDGVSATFDSAVLDEPLEILGFADLELELASDKPLAMVSARLCELRADGPSLMVTRHQLNLTHRNSHEHPEPLEPGRRYSVSLRLDSIAHRFEAGSRVRLSISPAYFPLAWPSPEEVTLTISGGKLTLPVRPERAEDAQIALPEPVEPEHLELETVRSGVGGRRIEHDLGTDRKTLHFDWDMGGLYRIEQEGIEAEDAAWASYSVVNGDPLSARTDCRCSFILKRDEDWDTSGEARSAMTCTATHYLIDATLDCYEGDRRVFTRAWSWEIPRDHG